MLEPGQTVDRYRVLAPIGEGGMAKVFQVEHLQLGTLHALKVHGSIKNSIKMRFEREGRLQASLSHPNLVRVFDVIDLGERAGLLMDYVNGPSLSGLLRRGRLPANDAVALFRGIATGLGHAHASGLIHRDLKPANVLINVDEAGITPKLTDFGLAKNLLASPELRTRTGATLGTPSYMPPEQIRDASTVDHRADLYGLGCLLYALCCSRPPYRGGDVIDLLQRIEAREYAPPKSVAPDVPDGVAALIHDLLDPNPEGRPADVQEVLRRIVGQGLEPISTSTVRLAGDLAEQMQQTLKQALPAHRSRPATEAREATRALGIASTDRSRARLRRAAVQAHLELTLVGDTGRGLTALLAGVASGEPIAVVVIDDGPRGKLLQRRIAKDPNLQPCRVIRADKVPGTADELAHHIYAELARSGAGASTSATGARRKLLVVEDNRVQRTLLCHILHQLDYEVVAVGALGRAFTTLKGQQFDGLVVDVHLPDGSGLDLLNSKDARGEVLPTVVLTADLSVQIPDPAPGQQAPALLCKPFRRWELQSCLDGVLNPSSQHPVVVVDSCAIDRLAEVLGGGRGPVSDLIDVFLGDLTNEKAAWAASRAEADPTHILELVRRLQPATAHLGANALELGCERLAQAAAADNRAAIRALIDELLDLLDETAKQLIAYRQSRQAGGAGARRAS
ncbi:MAG: protein kinase [Myxococcota bacterium]